MPTDCIPIWRKWYELIVRCEAYAEDNDGWLLLRNGQSVYPEVTR